MTLRETSALPLTVQGKINKRVCDAVLRTGFVESPFYGWEIANAINWHEVIKWCKDLERLLDPLVIHNLVHSGKLKITKADLDKYLVDCFRTGVPDTLEFRLVCTLLNQAVLKSRNPKYETLDEPYVEGQEFMKAIKSNNKQADLWARSQGRTKQDRYFTILLTGNNGRSGVVYVPRVGVTEPQSPKQFIAYLSTLLGLPTLQYGKITDPISAAVVDTITPEIIIGSDNKVVLQVRVKVTDLATDQTGMFARKSVADIV